MQTTRLRRDTSHGYMAGAIVDNLRAALIFLLIIVILIILAMYARH